jgi:hypothetical protein
MRNSGAIFMPVFGACEWGHAYVITSLVDASRKFTPHTQGEGSVRPGAIFGFCKNVSARTNKDLIHLAACGMGAA